MALTTLDAVKAQGGIAITDTSKDAQLLSLISGVTDLLKQTLHRDIEKKTYTEYCSGDNTTILQLRQRPIISVTRVCEDYDGNYGQSVNAFPTSQDLVEGVDYAIKSGAKGVGSSGQLRRINGVWYRRPSYVQGKVALQPGDACGNIMVIYTAGYAPIPPAIAMMVNSTVLRTLATAAVGGAAQSMGYEDANISFFSPKDMLELVGTVERTLGAYKSIPV